MAFVMGTSKGHHNMMKWGLKKDHSPKVGIKKKWKLIFKISSKNKVNRQLKLIYFKKLDMKNYFVLILSLYIFFCHFMLLKIKPIKFCLVLPIRWLSGFLPQVPLTTSPWSSYGPTYYGVYLEQTNIFV